jgi:hypothetical protein
MAGEPDSRCVLVPPDLVAVNASGAEAAPDISNVGSPETYVGYDQAENFISPAVPSRTRATSTLSQRLDSMSGRYREIGRSERKMLL